MKTKSELPECPVATTVQLIGSKWKLLILRNLLIRPWRFNELKKDLDGISQKVLTDSLRSMEEDGLVIRTVYPEVPPSCRVLIKQAWRIHASNTDGNAKMGYKLQEQSLTCFKQRKGAEFSIFSLFTSVFHRFHLLQVPAIHCLPLYQVLLPQDERTSCQEQLHANA